MNKVLKFSFLIVVMVIGFSIANILWKNAENKSLLKSLNNSLLQEKDAILISNEWTPLFNGKDFEDWNLFLRGWRWFTYSGKISKVFTIDEDGTLHFYRDIPEGFGSKGLFGSRGIGRSATHGIMVTKRKYNKYHLKFEYKWGKKLVNDFSEWQYDSGLFYHITKIQVFPSGLQYQIRYDHLNNYNYSGEIRSHIKLQWYSANGISFHLPSKGGMLQPITEDNWKAYGVAEDASFYGLDNKWNQGEIIVMGDEYVIHKLNGVVVNMAVNLNVREGPIALEAETGEIFWRNIYIKEFANSMPIEEFL